MPRAAWQLNCAPAQIPRGLLLRQCARARAHEAHVSAQRNHTALGRFRRSWLLLCRDHTLCACTFPQPMPGHIRGSLKGLHLDKRFPAEPFAKEPVLGSSPRAIYHGARVVCAHFRIMRQTGRRVHACEPNLQCFYLSLSQVHRNLFARSTALI